MKVLIIGNSPKVLENEFGKEIDKFDIVIRINNFETKGFENQVGTKTDYLFCTFATRPSAMVQNFPRDKMYMFVADKYGQDEFIQTRVNKANGMQIDIKKVNILDSKIYLHELNKEIGIDLPQRPLTGTICMFWAMKHYPESQIFTYGIDYYKEGGETLYRYTGFNNKREPYFHHFVKEQQYYNKLIEENKIIGDLSNAKL